MGAKMGWRYILYYNHALSRSTTPRLGNGTQSMNNVLRMCAGGNLIGFGVLPERKPSESRLHLMTFGPLDRQPPLQKERLVVNAGKCSLNECFSRKQAIKHGLHLRWQVWVKVSPKGEGI